MRVGQLAGQLLDADARVLYQRLHSVDALQGGVDVHRVVDAEDGLADLVAAAGGAADHLLVENPRFDPAHEHQIADARHVDAGGKQVHGDGDVGIALVLVLLDQLVDLVALAGDLGHGGLAVFTAVQIAEGGIEQALDHIGVQVGGAEDQRLLITEGVEFLNQLLADDPVEVLVDHAAVEGIDFEVEFVVQLGGFDGAGLGVDHLDLCAFLEADAVLRQQGFIADWWLVVDQPVIRDGFAVGIGIYRLAEDFAGVSRRGSSQGDLHRIEVIQHAPVAGQVLGGIAGGQLAFGHFLIEGVPAVGLVDDDAVELIHRRGPVAHEQAAGHSLHRGDLDARFRLGGHVAQLGDVVNLRQAVILLQRRFMEGILRLLAQGGAVDQKQYPAKALGFEESVHQANDGAGLASAGGHRQ